MIDPGYEVIDYVGADLSQLSTEELKKLLHDETQKKSIANTNQLNRKILINSLYGALGSEHFRFYSRDNAEAVTSFGQVAIKWVQKAVNIYLNKVNNTIDKDYIVYIDTDSVVGETIINVNGDNISISDYFDSISDTHLVKDHPKDYVKIINSDITPSVNTKTGAIEHNKINYIMKHKVKKRMYKITVDNKSVTVTEDHSIMIKRDGLMISVKPSEIIMGDKIIHLNNEKYIETEDFIIENLGICEEWVYDIEVNNNHNFFGNDILVHNSIYVDLEDLMNKANSKAQKSGEELIDFVSVICEKMTESVINTCYERLRAFLNHNESHMNMDREAIAIEGGFFVAKKRYALSVNDNEGVRYKIPKMKLIGIETQRSTTPKAVTTALKDSINAIITKGESDLQAVVKAFDENFNKLPISQICYTSSANNIFNYSDDNYSPVKGCPGHIKGALAYNKYINDNNLTVDMINDGEKINIVTLKLPNPYNSDIFGWPAGGIIDAQFGDIEKYIDYQRMYDERFLKPLTNMTENIEDMEPVFKQTLTSFFG